MTENNDKNYSPNVNLYGSVVRAIEIDIITGKYQEGKRMLSILSIASMYGIGKSTAQKVVKTLCDDGIIHLKTGVGYFVKPFVSSKLRKKHIGECKNDLTDVIGYCLSLDFSKEEVLKMVKEILSNY